MNPTRSLLPCSPTTTMSRRNLRKSKATRGKRKRGSDEDEDTPPMSPPTSRPRSSSPARAPENDAGGESLTAARDLSFLDSHVLSRLKGSDLSGRILAQEDSLVGSGTYSDVFRGKCRIENRGEVVVAMKRLRLHVEGYKASCKNVRSLISVTKSLLTFNDCSCLKRKSTSGRNSSIQTCFLFLDTHSTEAPVIRFSYPSGWKEGMR